MQNVIDFQTSAIAEYKQVAKMAWGGEIPSPLPGHESSEEKMVECFEYLNCPCCGGSGHVGDCDNAIQNLKCKLVKSQSEAKRLEKEVDWLARSRRCKTVSQYRGMSGVCPAIHSEKDSDIKPCGVFGQPFYTQDECAALWRKTAREAVAEAKNA